MLPFTGLGYRYPTCLILFVKFSSSWWDAFRFVVDGLSADILVQLSGDAALTEVHSGSVASVVTPEVSDTLLVMCDGQSAVHSGSQVIVDGSRCLSDGQGQY